MNTKLVIISIAVIFLLGVLMDMLFFSNNATASITDANWQIISVDCNTLSENTNFEGLFETYICANLTSSKAKGFESGIKFYSGNIQLLDYQILQGKEKYNVTIPSSTCGMEYTTNLTLEWQCNDTAYKITKEKLAWTDGNTSKKSSVSDNEYKVKELNAKKDEIITIRFHIKRESSSDTLKFDIYSQNADGTEKTVLDPFWRGHNTEYKIKSNATSTGTFSINDTGGINSGNNKNIIWFFNTSSNGSLSAYFNSTDFTSFGGIANDTTEMCWENETTRTGNCPTVIWNQTGANIGVFHFNREPILQDSSPNNTDGTISGSVTNTTGVFGNAFNFTGGNVNLGVYAITNNMWNNYGNGWTVEYWAYYDGIGGIDFNFGDAVSVQCCINRNYYLSQFDGISTDNLEFFRPLNKTWYHYIFTGDGTTMYVYINGIFNISSPQGKPSPNLILADRIGSTNDGTLPSNITIDEMRIYTKNFTADDVLNNFRNGGDILGININNLTSLVLTINSAPTISSLSFSPANGTAYTSGNQINISGNTNDIDGDGVTIWIQHDANQSLSNATNRTNGGVTVSGISSNTTGYNWWAILVDFNASTHAWKVYANDSSNAWATTQDVFYNVGNGTPTLSITGSNVTYPALTNTEGSETQSGDSGCTYNFYVTRAGTLISSGSTVIDTTRRASGTRTYYYNTTGCFNYTSGESSRIINIATNSTTVFTITVNGTTYANKWVNNGTIINITATWNATNVFHSWELTTNITDTNSGWSNLSTSSYFNITNNSYTIIASNNTIINVTASYTGTENYTTTINSTFVKIDMTPPRSYGFSPENSTSNLYNGTSGIHYFSISVFDNITETTNQSGTDKVTAELNGVNYSTTYSSNTGLSTIAFVGMSTGSHTIKWFANDTLNNQELLTIQSYSLTSSQMGGGGGGGGYVPPTVSFAIGDGICEKDKGETIELSEDCIIKETITEIPSLAKFYAFAIIASLIGIYYAQKQRTSKTKIKYR